MKPFAVQIEEIREAIDIRLENYKDAVEKYHAERARIRDKYFGEGFREDIAAEKAEAETVKIKTKVEAIAKELDKMVVVLRNINPDKIDEEKREIARKYFTQKSTVAEGDRTKGVLIAEDAAFMRELIRTTLTANRIKIAGEAENGRIAVEKYKEILPELVILDIDMPEMDGIEALKAMKEFDPDAKVIMCSQVSKQSTVDEAIRFGALNFIAKPFKPEKLSAIVKQALTNN